MYSQIYIGNKTDSPSPRTHVNMAWLDMNKIYIVKCNKFLIQVKKGCLLTGYHEYICIRDIWKMFHFDMGLSINYAQRGGVGSGKKLILQSSLGHQNALAYAWGRGQNLPFSVLHIWWTALNKIRFANKKKQHLVWLIIINYNYQS